jgi:hypothetical protein
MIAADAALAIEKRGRVNPAFTYLDLFEQLDAEGFRHRAVPRRNRP